MRQPLEHSSLRLTEKTIVADLTAGSYSEAVGILIRLALAEDKEVLANYPRMPEFLQQQDPYGGILLNTGVVLPHTWVEGITEEKTAFGLCRQGILCNERCELNVYAIFLCLHPHGTWDLSTMEAAVSIFGPRRAAQRLRSCRSASDIFNFFKESESRRRGKLS